MIKYIIFILVALTLISAFYLNLKKNYDGMLSQPLVLNWALTGEQVSIMTKSIRTITSKNYLYVYDKNDDWWLLEKGGGIKLFHQFEGWKVYYEKD